MWATGAQIQRPSYTAAGIVNAASYSADGLTPNAIVSLFGTDLSFETASATGSGGPIPTSLGGVTVYIGGTVAGLFYVSPTQINFLIPNVFLPGQVKIQVGRDAISGPPAMVTLHDAGPGLFQDGNGNAIATHLDGSVLSATSPAHPGEWVVLYANGLGLTIPLALNYTPIDIISPLSDMKSFSVLLDGAAVDPKAIYYAGLAPGFVGLYQVNLHLPDNVGPNPEIRIGASSEVSVSNIHLAVQ